MRHVLVDKVDVFLLVDQDGVFLAHPVRRKDDDSLGLQPLRDFPSNVLQDRIHRMLGVVLNVWLWHSLPLALGRRRHLQDWMESAHPAVAE